ncbi:MAG: phosphoenolpyruvate hydrolase family protein [Selenomonas sp.]|nr:phosphoenolpyruvate hydrolase family protein [Selenomonas sp.]
MVDMEREQVLRLLRAQLHVSGHIIGAAVGSGMTAKLAAMGGADILLALSAGKYRIMGRSSFSSYFCYGNNNEQVMELGKREIFPIIRNVPLLFGLMATDPTVHMYDYMNEIKASGFSGVVNFPTVALIDGKFREALEEEGTTYHREIAAIRLASHLGLFAMAFVTSKEETEKMLAAGADVICVHLGLTRGGFLGAKRHLSLGEAHNMTKEIFGVCKEKNPGALRMIYAGPANTLTDMQYLYKNTECQGYIGGSTFDRIPMEAGIFETVKAFKQYKETEADSPFSQLMNRKHGEGSVVDTIRQYIEEHYMDEVQLGDIALVAHMSPTYLSARFKREMGTSFTEYLLQYRIGKAKELLQQGGLPCKEVAQSVGYADYIQFSKMFKKYVGVSPKEYQRRL